MSENFISDDKIKDIRELVFGDGKEETMTIFDYFNSNNFLRVGVTKENPNYIGGIAKSEKLSEIYEDIAVRNDCEFMGNEDLIVGEDGLHLSRDGHRILASKLAIKVQGMY